MPRLSAPTSPSRATARGSRDPMVVTAPRAELSSDLVTTERPAPLPAFFVWHDGFSPQLSPGTPGASFARSLRPLLQDEAPGEQRIGRRLERGSPAQCDTDRPASDASQAPRRRRARCTTRATGRPDGRFRAWAITAFTSSILSTTSRPGIPSSADRTLRRCVRLAHSWNGQPGSKSGRATTASPT